MRKIKKYAKTTLCLALSTATLLTNMEVSASAMEHPSQEDVVAEEQTRESETEEPETKATETVESTAVSDEDEKTQETSTEEAESETETVMETEIAEADQNTASTASGTIAQGAYRENGNNLTWVIDKNGRLTVEGTGDFEETQQKPWYENAKDIQSAVIKITGMKNACNMFAECENLKSVVLSDWNMSSVTNMKGMFWGCAKLTSVDLSGCNTGSVTDMSEMFEHCTSLTSLDLKDFNTGSVTNMESMFAECFQLKSVNLSSFNTKNVTNMTTMFFNCESLESVNLSGFDTRNVYDMQYMFGGCYRLTSLDFSSFDASRVTQGQGLVNTDNNYALTQIHTPRNLNVSVALDGNWYDVEGNTYTELPKGRADSILLCKNKKPIVKENVKITGIEMKNSVYNKRPVSYTGTAKAEADGKELTKSVKLTYRYSGTQADGSAYADTPRAPVNAGNYKLTVSVSEDDEDYVGSVRYVFTIAKAPLTITACDMELKTGASLPREKDYQYGITGLFEGDGLTAEPVVTCNIADTATAGTYRITVTGADAGMNYAIAYQNGTLTVSENGENTAYYSVTFSLSGRGSNITNTGMKSGSLLKKPQDPLAKGYTFTGWYKDPICTALWDFDKDTVQSDTIIYAGWTANGTGGGGDWNDKDDSAYSYSKRTDLTSADASIADIKAKVYDANEYKPVVKVTATVNGKKTILTEGADYRVLYQNYTDAGKGKVIVKGNGIYKGQIDKDFTIKAKPVKKLKILTSGVVGNTTLPTTDKLATLVYVYDGAKRLQEGSDKDYVLSVQFVKTGIQVTVKGVNNYEGTATATHPVYENSTQLITADDVKLDKTITAYTGKAVKPEVTVTVNGALLTNRDYKVQYQNNKDAGTAFVIVTGKGDYKGKAVVPFTIKAETIVSADDFTIKEISAKTYNGKLQKPSLSVTIKKNGKDKKLSKKDYTVAYQNNFHAGEATVTVTGRGNYEGLEATATFTIKPQQMKKASLKGTKDHLTLTYSNRKLKEGTDYEKPVYGEEKKNKVEVTIKGKSGGDFTGELKKSVVVN